MALKKNKVFLIGRIGRDPEVRFTAGGTAVASLTIATDEGYKDKNNGEWVDKVEWHQCVAWGKLAEYIGDKLPKGRLVSIEGKLQTRKWQDKDGNDRYTTEIVIDDISADSPKEGGDKKAYTPKPQSDRTQDGNYTPRSEPSGMDDAPF